MFKYIILLYTLSFHLNAQNTAEIEIFCDSLQLTYGLKEGDTILLAPIYSEISEEYFKNNTVFYIKNNKEKYAIYSTKNKQISAFKFDQFGYNETGFVYLDDKGKSISYKELEKNYLGDGKPIQFIEYGIDKMTYDDIDEIYLYCDFLVPHEPITHKKTNKEVQKIEKLAITAKVNGKWGVINENGSFYIEAKYEKRPFLSSSSSNIWFVSAKDEVKLYDIDFNPILTDKTQFLFPDRDKNFSPYILLITSQNDQYISVIDQLGIFSSKFPYIAGETHTEIDEDLNFFIVENKGKWSAISTFESERGVIARTDSYEALLKAMKKFNNDYPNRID